jgi:hypothetical protein
VKTEDRLAPIVRSIQTRGPRPGDRYRHYKGGEYEVLDSAIQENPLAHVVVYRNLAEGHLWVRPIDDWLALVEVDGRRVPRFARLESAS